MLTLVEKISMNRICVVLISCLIAACSQSSIVQAKPSAPVVIDYDKPKNSAVGELVTTTVRFKAKTYLQQLVVSVTADRGLTLESGIDPQVFTNIDTGAMREIEIGIILTDGKAYLAVAVETTDSNGRIRYKNKMIKFTSDSFNNTQLKDSDVDAGEQLILMPAEVE
jgi:hypothetical protein